MGKKERLASDGLEEKKILYRILREIQIDTVISELQEQESTQS